MSIRMRIASLLFMLAVPLHALHAQTPGGGEDEALELQDFDIATATEVAMEGMEKCINWCVTGVCFFLVPNCTPIGCFPTIETTPRIKHDYPDVIVSAWTTRGNPFTEGGDLYDELQHEVGSSFMGGLLGGGQSVRHDAIMEEATFGEPTGDDVEAVVGSGDREEQQRSTHLRFKYATVIGHPITAASEAGDGDIPGICPSEVTPMMAYYLSDLDALSWRGGGLDLVNPIYLLYAMVPGLSEVGLWPLNVYGPRFPRTGFVNQYNDYMSAAVAAERAIHIATRQNELRIYQPLHDENMPEDVEPPGPSPDNVVSSSDEAELRGGPWQMIMPRKDKSCHTMGAELDFARSNDFGRYGWNYWQTYKCCLTRNGIYLGSVEDEEGDGACLETN